MGIKDRIEKLERGSVSGPELELAEAVLAARHRFERGQATDADHKLLTANNWLEALLLCIQAAGGLEAVLQQMEAHDRQLISPTQSVVGAGIMH
jgi:hypothetical protein